MRSPFNCARIKYEYNTNHNTVLVRCVIIILFGVISRIKKWIIGQKKNVYVQM